MLFLFFVRLWIWISALAGAAGWTLSAFGALNRPGYIVFFVLSAAVLWCCRGPLELNLPSPALNGRKLRWRFRHPFPLGFGILAGLVFLGGLLYAPSTHTAYTYHIPRALHWLARGHWYWIHTPVTRMNHSGCGYEWLCAPMLLFTKSDRGLFLLNYIPYLLLPGLIFGVCRYLGVRPRAAWHWMWLLPTGYTFLVQSGNAGNDVFAADFALAMVYFGCRAWQFRRVGDLWLLVVASALLTSVKISNAPLVLASVVLFFACLPLLQRHWIATGFVFALAVVASFLPSAATNKYYCGDYLGVSIEVPHLEMHNPVIGLWGNALQLLLDNFVPPFFLPAGWWNAHFAEILPQRLVTVAVNNFDGGFFWLGELPTEDWAGVGFGLSVLILVSVIAASALRRTGPPDPAQAGTLPRWLRNAVLVAPWLALLVYCVMSGLVTAARLISPYYALLLPLLIIGAGQGQLVRRRWWRFMAGGVMALAMAVVLAVPGRPLWPAQTLISGWLAAHPGPAALARAQKVYAVYAGRSDPLAGIRRMLPPDLKVIGFMGTADDIDISLWRPFGTRRVEHILLSDSPADIRKQGIEYAVVGGCHLEESGTTLEAWLQRTGGQLVAGTNATMKVSEGSQPWYLVKLNE